uniref:non-specific serine/threonine protein kinase n=1 Tax=Vitis vinifera TaxID=29760 RepID=A5B4N2_VITVI|nr:hypothetical protein VITISV_028029 [Vitis vinifera]
MSSHGPPRNYRALKTNLKTCAKGTKLRVYSRCLHKSWRSSPGAPYGMVGVGKIGRRESSLEKFAGGEWFLTTIRLIGKYWEMGKVTGMKHGHRKGLLSDGTVIAVKQLSSKSKQGNRPEECQLQLDWPTRHRICVGIARVLAYLHEESRLKIIHQDIKATNVLLDKNLNPKISDFGLAKLDEEDNTHISTRIAGALLGSDFNKEEVLAMINIALLSTKVSPAVRPAMSSVVSMLEGRTAVQDIVSDPSVPSDDLKLKEMKEHYYYTQEKIMGVSESMPDRPWTASSSIPDLYPVTLDFEYWENRD